MKKICVYTCITGNYDNLNEINNPEPTIDYYCFTNNKNLKSKTWKIIQISDPSLDDCRLARKIKILGHPKINSKYDTFLWTDANIVWKTPISKFIKTYATDSGFTIPKHHNRSSIHEEAIACLKYRKEDKANIVKLLNFYKNHPFPDRQLYETTVFIKKLPNKSAQDTTKTWFNMVKNYSKRDQLSFTYAAYQNHLKIAPIDINVWDNPWFYATKHISTPALKDCFIYFGNPDQISNFDLDSFISTKFTIKNDTYSFEITIPKDTSIISINPTNDVGIKFSDLKISPHPNTIEYYGSVSYSGETAFCSGYNTIRIFGNYKKDSTLSFSIKMQPLDRGSLLKLTENLWAKNSQLFTENQSLTSEINSIKSSRSYKVATKLHKIIKPR